MKLNNKMSVLFSVDCQLTESEARALEALAGYGLKPFLQAFYQHLGRSYLERHESGLRTLFEKITSDVKPALHQIDEARKVLKDA